MDRELRKKAFTLAEEALGKDERDRDAWVKAACGEDEALLGEVNAILDVDRSGAEISGVFSGFDNDAPEQLIGKTLGRYRITELLGEGGMGVVFKGERVGEFQQTVAIKIVRQGLDSRNARARFDLERDALARIEHPYIARIIDAGVDDHGRPYFVMEYVDGVPLSVFLERNDLSLRDRLVLFTRICDAVAAAHRMLVIHRDLKPSNVLVTDDLQPKLLDFGISKLVTEDQRPDVARDSTQLFTPEYASPEQIVGGHVTTATDVYGLGALLYFMLSGERPFGTRTGALFDYLKSTLEDEPAPPSIAIREHARTELKSWSSARMVRAVTGDVDNITMRALAKQPEDRYGSVAELAEDVQRFLDGKAVLAKPPSLAYRVSKFVRRHWVESSLAALLLMSLVAGLGVSIWQANVASYERDQADARFNETRALVNYMMNELYADLDNIPGGSKLRVSIAETSQRYLDGLSATRPEDPLLLVETAQGYRQLGDMQGSPQEVSLNRPDLAERSYSNALKLLEQAQARLHGDDVGVSLKIAQERAVTALKLARLMFMHSYDADWASYSAEAVAGFESLIRKQDDFETWLRYMDARLLDADVAVYAENWQHAESVLDRIVADLDKMNSRWTEEEQRQWDSTRMRALATQADLYFYQRRYDEALVSANKMVEAVTRLRLADEDNIALRRAAWVARHKAAQSEASLGGDEAVIQTMTEAIAIINVVLEAEPGDAHAKEMLAESNRLIGDAHSNLEEHQQAIDFAKKVVDYYVEATAESPESERVWRLLADARRAYATVLENAGFRARSCVQWATAQELVNKLYRDFTVSEANEETLVMPIKEGVARCNSISSE